MMSRRLLGISIASVGWVLVSAPALTGCSTLIPKDKGAQTKDAGKKADGKTAEQQQATASVLAQTDRPVRPAAVAASPEVSQVVELNARLAAMELKLAALQDKLSTAEQALNNGGRPASPAVKAYSVPVVPHPTERGGVPVASMPVPGDPETGFTNDLAVQTYRKAMILYRADRYSDAVLAFSGFLEKYPDHPVAGTAQFYVGQSYLRQKEFKLAIQEFQRVLTSYDRSPHIAQTLHDMADAEDRLRRTGDAARHRQLLMSLFPHSPFALKSPQTALAAPVPAEEIAPQVAPPVKSLGAKLDGPPPTVPLVPKVETHPAQENEGEREN